MRILLVEDDPLVSQTLDAVLTRANHSVYAVEKGEEAIELAKLFDYDAIVLDLGLPDIGGHQVVMRLRRESIETPILILTGDGKTESKLDGFDRGADDYLTKPVNGAELVARIQAVVRRFHGHSRPLIKTGSITVDLTSKTVSIENKLVPLTGVEYRVFEFLCLRKGATVTREMLLDHLYGGTEEPNSKTIDVFISKLRKKLRVATDGEIYIETVRGLGYILRDPKPEADSVKNLSSAQQNKSRG